MRILKLLHAIAEKVENLGYMPTPAKPKIMPNTKKELNQPTINHADKEIKKM